VPAKVEVRMALCVVRVKQALVRGDHQGGAVPARVEERMALCVVWVKQA
jgi:hypothetical protein